MALSALGLHRIANRLWRWHVPLLPRFIDMVICVVFTAIIPHKAKIGENCAMLHRGMGLVIGQDAELGDGVIIAPFASIGAGASPMRVRIEDDAIIGAHALIVGDVTIGKGAIVGAGAIVVEDVPPGGVAVSPAGEVIRINREGGKKYLADLNAS